MNDKVGGVVKIYWLIDGFYVIVVCNVVLVLIVGEVIVYLVFMIDLKWVVRFDEWFILLFIDVLWDEKRGGGKVLFVGIWCGDNWLVCCYVFKVLGNWGFVCVNEGGKFSLFGVMFVFVKGVLMFKFGMCFYFIKKI